MEDQFYDHLPEPEKDEGQALTNKEASIDPSRNTRDGKRYGGQNRMSQNQIHTDGDKNQSNTLAFELQKPSLRTQLIKTRQEVKQLGSDFQDWKVYVQKKKKEHDKRLK